MILIKNARVMDPESGFDQVTDILLDGKKIRQIGKVNDVSGIEQVINASGMIAAPGLIDVHVHFRDPDLHTRKIYRQVLLRQQLVDLQR